MHESHKLLIQSIKDRDAGRYPEAISMLEQVAQDPQYRAAAYLQLGTIARRQRRFDAAEKYLTSIFAMTKGNFDLEWLHYELGLTYSETQRPHLAETHFGLALHSNPANDNAAAQLGLIHFNGGDHRLAENYFLQALKLNPKNSISLMTLGVIYRRLGQHEKSKSYLEEALRADPENPLVQLQYGVYLRIHNDCAGARKYLQRALQLNPHLAGSNAELGWLALSEQQFDEAENQLMQAYTMDPMLIEALLGLGLLYKRKGNLIDARCFFEKAVVASPANEMACLELGLITEQLNDLKAAFGYYKKALTLNTNCAPARTRLDAVERYLNLSELLRGPRHHSSIIRSRLIEAIQRIQRDPIKKPIYVLSEDFSSTPLPEVGQAVTGYFSTIESLEGKQPGEVVCYFENDEKGWQAFKRLQALGHICYMVDIDRPVAHYFYRNSFCRQAMLATVEAARIFHLSHLDADCLNDWENIMQALEITRPLPGCYVELGVMTGTSAHAALQYIKGSALNRPAIFMDTYHGFDYPEAFQSADSFWKGTHQFSDSAEKQMQFVSTHLKTVGPPFELVKTNICTDDFPPHLTEIAVCNIDVDMYEAIKSALFKIARRIVRGGIIIVEDVGHTPLVAGGNLAVHEFMSSEFGRMFTPVYIASGQMFLIKTIH